MTFKHSLVLSSAIAVLAACAGTPEAAAPVEQAAGDDEKVTVTGARIRRDEFSSDQPLQVLDADAAKSFGVVDASSLGLGASASGAQVDASINNSVNRPPRRDRRYDNKAQAFPQPAPGDVDLEEYPDAPPNSLKLVSEEPVSTFSVDVDTASYAVARSYLENGQLPPGQAVRVEEMINYFDYAYPLPDRRDQPFSVSAVVAPTPWNANTQLIHIGLKGYDIVPDQRPRANLVLLLDVSGSMNAPNKLPLLKKSLRLLVDQLEDDDLVSIVVYAGAAGQVLEPTLGRDKAKILSALNALSAGGSTAGGEGLRLAYSLAEANFDENAVNRVILATDGDFNVGVTQNERLEDFVERKRETGIYLSVLGFGRGNYKDSRMQTIAQAGNGVAAYIDSLNEARKVLHDEMTSTLFPIANDVKIQVEFNPARVAEYRLIGYETRVLNREDFNNDKVDAGEIGAGHEVTAVYEISAPDSNGRLIDERRYAEAESESTSASNEYGFLRVRYKLPGENDSKLIERPITNSDAADTLDNVDPETRWAVAVAAFGQLIRDEPYLNGFSYADIIELAKPAVGEDPFGYRAEFLQLARLAETGEALLSRDRFSGGE